MKADNSFSGIPCQDWTSENFDALMLRDAPAEQLEEFRRQVHLLTDEAAAELKDRLFRGIRQPFHYIAATGWMGDALRLDEGKARYVPLGEIKTVCGWNDDTVVFLSASRGVLVSRWSWIRSCLQAGWLADCTWHNLAICVDESRWVAVYFEGGGPRCVRRGKRRLLTRR